MRHALIPGLIFAALVGFAGLLWVDSTRLSREPNLIGQQAPLNHPLIGQGIPILINFWFSTCAPCQVEHPILMNLAEDGLNIIGVNRDVSTQAAAAFLTDLGNPYAAQIYDPRDEIAKDFQITAWPTSILVAGNGLIQGIYGPLVDPMAQVDMKLTIAPEIIFTDPVEEARAQALFSLINCLDCEANTIRESGGDFALQMRKLVRAWLQEGRNRAEIQATLIARYGPQIWLDPPLGWNTAALYLLPFLVLILGGFLLWRRGP